MSEQPTTTREFVLPLENKPGTFAEIATALGKANINILGFVVEAQGEYGIARLVTNEPAKTESWLKTTNKAYRANDILIMPASNEPGEAGRIASKLALSGVNILASYATLDVNKKANLVFAVDNLASAKKILGP